MVSKVAVIAIVGILAVPIIMGYAFNFEQTTETDYKTVGDPVDVTQLLYTGADYTYTYADPFKLNTDFNYGIYGPVIPEYERKGNTKTSLNLVQSIWPETELNIKFNEWSDKYAQVNALYTAAGQNEKLVVYDTTNNNNIVLNINYMIHLYYDAQAAKLYYSYYDDSSHTRYTNATYNVTNTNFLMHIIKVSGTFDVLLSLGRTTAYQYVDISAGFTFHYCNYSSYIGEDYDNVNIGLPDYTRNMILTIDLDSITESNYKFGIGTQCYIEKTTTNGEVSWQVKPRPRISDNIVQVTDLYYDNTSSNNVYQVKIWMEPYGEPTDVPGYSYYIQHYEFRYVGVWPTFIGEADYYQSFDVKAGAFRTSPNFNSVLIGGFSEHSPIMRVDSAEFRAMEYPTITDKTYDPAAFKNNPSTTITDPKTYGSSITFGNVTYKVTKGNITIGTHDIPVKDLVLSSIPNHNGGFDNKIGNTVISTTAYPSTITFNGKWSATITTAAQEEEQITRTEWKAGEFAWNGIDHNFIMVGLLASIGAFIALGIYARRTKSSVWPLLIVCGCSALVFFALL